MDVGVRARTALALFVRPFRTFWSTLEGFAWSLAALVALGGVAAASETLLLVLIGSAVVALGTGAESLSLPMLGNFGSSHSLFVVGLGMGILLVRTGATVAGNWVQSAVVARYEHQTRKSIISSYLNADWQSQQRLTSGDVLTLVVWDVDSAKGLLETGLRAILPVISLVFMLVTSLAVGPLLTLGILGIALVMLGAMRPLAIVARTANELRGRAFTEFGDELYQDLAVSREIAVFGVRDFFDRRVGGMLTRMAELARSSAFLGSNVTAVYQVGTYFAALCMLAGISRLQGGALHDAAPVVLILVRSLSYSQALQGAIHAIEEREVNLDRIQRTRRALAAHGGGQSGTRIDKVRRLDFENVSFVYEKGSGGVRGLSFTLEPGQIVGIVGPSGGGKSTLVSLAMGLLHPMSGEVRVNGVPLAEVDASSWNTQLAIVPQEPVLVPLTVAENIRFGRPSITDAAVTAAAVESGVATEMERLAIDYDEQADERGRRFSVGQRQRICIARALAGKPSLVVFDEPTSALDPVSEEIVHSALRRLREQAIVMIVTHRESTARSCDWLLVLNDGCLTAAGPPNRVWGAAHERPVAHALEGRPV